MNEINPKKLGAEASDPSLSGLPTGPKERAILKDRSKLIAFYLPQYHQIPENSEWWGPGFTEWTNVARAKPNFDGHHQPNIPRELGFYDLTHPDTLKRQVELAKANGIYGFCFYYYWFSGRRILEKPIDLFERAGLDIDYCFCWANENWTRAWDGDTKSVLLKQKYEDGDAETFIASLIDSFRKDRYIKIDGCPLLLVYRAKDIPEPSRWFDIWRGQVQKAGFPGLHIAAIDFHDITTPDEVGADSLVEFPPHKFSGPHNRPDAPPVITNPRFAGGVIDYTKMILQSSSRKPPEFKLFRGIIPSWDNTPRRQDTPTIVVNSRADLYGAWLSYLRTYSRAIHSDEGSRFIFVNAWNEWGEGCYLEPDLRSGLAYLDATYRSAFYEAGSDTTGDIPSARAALLNRLAETMAAEGVDNVERKLSNYRVPSRFVRRVASALAKWPLFHKIAKFAYEKAWRVWR